MATASVGSFGIDFFLETARFREATAAIKRDAEKAANGAKGAFDGMERQFSRSTRGMSGVADNVLGRIGAQLRGLAGAYAGLQGVQALGSVSDSYARIQSQLAQITETEGERQQLTQRVYEIAQLARVEFEAQAKLVTRLTVATSQMKVSQEEVLRVSKAVSQTFAIAGATSAEAASSAQQFAQALGSGQLQGDELRAIVESNLTLAEAIADSLGVSVGQLKQMGADGKLVSEVVFGAILRQAGEINEKFEKTIPTLAQSSEVLRNSLVVLVGKLDEALGVSAGISGKLSEAADALKRGADFAAKYKTELGGVAAALGAVLEKWEVIAPVAYTALGKAFQGANAAFSPQLPVPIPPRDSVAPNSFGLLSEMLDASAPASGRTTDPPAGGLGGVRAVVRDANREAEAAAEAWAESVEGAAVRSAMAWEAATRSMGEQANAAAEEMTSAFDAVANDAIGSANAQIEANLEETFALMDEIDARAAATADEIALVFEDGVFAYFEEGWSGVAKVFERALAEMTLQAGRAAFADILRDKFASIFTLKSDEGGIAGGVLDAIIGGVSSYFGGGTLSKAGASGPSGGLKGFATGGSFVVGGPTSGDNVLTAFMANGGETVTVTPRGQGGGGGVTLVQHNDFRGADPGSEARLLAAQRQNSERLKAEIFDLIRRGRSG